MSLTVDRKNDILEKMNKLSAGVVYKLDVKDVDQQDAFKYIIREKQDVANGYLLTFSSNYAKIMKSNLPSTENETYITDKNGVTQKAKMK